MLSLGLMAEKARIMRLKHQPYKSETPWPEDLPKALLSCSSLEWLE